jgi:fatty-acyl-CoA synthase
MTGGTSLSAHDVLDRAPQQARTTADLYRIAGERFHDSVFAIEGDRAVTYGEVVAQATRLAASLVRAGVQRGDRVAHWMGNGIAWVVTKLGVELAGAVHVPLSAHLRTEDAGYVLRHSGSVALVVGAPIDPAMLLAMVDASDPQSVRSRELPALRLVIADGISGPDVVPLASLVPSTPEVADLAELPELTARWAAMAPTDLVNILYTSGTTGAPKGAMITHRNILTNADAGPPRLNRTSDDRWLVALPLFHTFGCMMGLVYPLTLGASIVLMQRFSAEGALEAIERHRCTVLEGVPTMFSDILEHPSRAERDLTSWRKLYIGGSYSTEAFIARLRDELGVTELVTGFGMTEHSGLSLATRPGDPFEVISRTIGGPLPGAFEFAILDQDGRPVPDGVEGEICARGPSVFQGYYENPAQTQAAFHADGWMRSGDLGRIDVASGYVQITGRLKEIIISGGENIAPAEIENLIARHPAVAEVHVCGVPHKRLGEVPVAFVRLVEDAELTEEEVVSFCRARVASLKAPRHVFFEQQFPRTPTGKVQKYRLKEIARNQLESR